MNQQQPPNHPGYGHPQGYGPPQGYGGPPPKKGMSNGMIALIVVGCLFGGCTLLGAIGAATNKNQAETTAATTTAAAPEAKPSPTSTPEPKAAAAPSFPWVATVRANCAAYKAAPNEIKKSAIFRANQELLAGTGVQNARGRLATLRTNQGGSELTITIKTDDVEFNTEGLLHAIKQGSPVYEAASEMKVGQCVVFSAKGLKASSMAERSQVCDLEYFADFTSLAPCQ